MLGMSDKKDAFGKKYSVIVTYRVYSCINGFETN